MPCALNQSLTEVPRLDSQGMVRLLRGSEEVRDKRGLYEF